MALFVDEEKCSGCTDCVSLCPAEAISIINGKAAIDQAKCKECLLCLDECPSDAIYQVLEREDSLIPEEKEIPKFVSSIPHQQYNPFGQDLKKQQAIGIGTSLLNGMVNWTRNFFNEHPMHGDRRKGGGRPRRLRRRHGRW